MIIIRWGPDMPVGSGLRLTDEEVIYHYLRLKMIGKLPKKDDVIAELDDFYEWDAKDLPAKSKTQSDDQMWWFFCRRDHIDSTSNRWNRQTKSGFWKITGQGRVIKDQETQKCIGKTKILVFHEGRSPGRKTNWVVHEYHSLLPNVVPNQGPYVLCRLEKKTSKKVFTRGCDEGESSASVISKSNIDNSVIPGAISEVLGQAEVNPVTLGAISEVPGQIEENADEDIHSIFSGSCDDDRESNLLMQKCHLEEENPFNHKQANFTCPLENKTDEKAGTPDCDTGEPSGIITYNVKNQAATVAIPEVHGHTEVDAGLWSQLGLPPDCYFTMEDLFSNLHDDDEKINSLMHEPEPEHRLPHQQANVTCPLENKTDEKVGTPDYDTGEPSGIIMYNVKIQAATAAIPEVYGLTEVDAGSWSQLGLPLDCYFRMEDLFSNLHDDDDEKINSLMHEPEPDYRLPHQANVTCPLENKTDEKAGTPDYDTGEPSAIITYNVKNQAATAAIPKVHGHTEVDAGLWSQLGLPLDCYFTMEDLFSNLHDDDEKINSLMHEPEPEHRLPHQWPNVICNLENKTIEKAGIPGCDIGEPSGNITSDIGNQVAPTAIPKVHCRAEVYAESSLQPIQSPDCCLPTEDFSTSYNCDHNKQGLCEAGEPEESPEEFADRIIVYPSENCCNRGTPIQPMSLKRPHLPDALASSGVDAVGVEERVKRPRSLAHEDTLHSLAHEDTLH